MINVNRSFGLLFCFAAIATVPAMAGIIVGLPADSASGNCYPFGCAYSGEYQQVYTASQFPSTITITGLDFFNTAFNSMATAMNSGTWTISLSTTSANWNTLSSTFASNIGPNNTTVFSGNLSQPWTFGDTLFIPFTTPFTYNPASGNLLMDVNVSGASTPGGDIFFDANGTNVPNTIMGRVFCNGCSTPGVQNGYGVVTGFITSSPEPSFLYALGAALATLAITQRIRTHKTAN